MYRELAEIPTPTAGVFLKENVVEISFSVKDHDKKETRNSTKVFSLLAERPAVHFVGPAQQQSKDLITSAFSPSKALRAALIEKKGGDKGADATRWVEVWKGDYLQFSREVTKHHGAFYDDFHYNSLSFSPSEDALIYTAEAKAPENSDDDPFRAFRFTPPLGEGFIGRKRPTLFYLRWNPLQSALKDGVVPTSLVSVSLAKVPPHHVHLGQGTFLADDHVVATGYEQSPDGKLLGLKHCVNRPAGIWDIHFPPTSALPGLKTSEHDVIDISCGGSKRTTDNTSCRSPVFQKDLAKLFWLSNGRGGPHGWCVGLSSGDIDGQNRRTLIEIVDDPKPGAFPGLYPEFRLPPSPFLQLGAKSYLVFHSTWGSRTVVLLVSADDGTVKKLDEDESKLFSWKVLATDSKNRIICVRSSPSVPPEVVLGTLNEAGAVTWSLLHRPDLTPEVGDALSTLQTEIIPIPGRHPVETILLRVKDVGGEIRPCVTNPHGGPHGATSTAFTPAIAARALNGYTVSMPNFTGSTGYGQKHIEALLGKCGTLDVQDCKATVDHLVSLGISRLGPGYQFIQGGSHGGFLTAHLIAQYPDLFTAAVMRNPVISIGEVSTSDIQDWYYEECNIRYTQTSVVTPEIYETMYRSSPIAHVDHVKAPVLLLLGEMDQRVAPTQGIALYHALKGRGQTAELLMFPKESHGLEGVESSAVGFRAEMEWWAWAKFGSSK